MTETTIGDIVSKEDLKQMVHDASFQLQCSITGDDRSGVLFYEERIRLYSKETK